MRGADTTAETHPQTDSTGRAGLARPFLCARFGLRRGLTTKTQKSVISYVQIATSIVIIMSNDRCNNRNGVGG